MIISDLNNDVMLCIYDFVSFAEMWSLSRTCSDMYNMINPNLYRMFMNRYYKIQPSFINGRHLFDAYFKNNETKYEWCIFTGSSVLSVLLGKNWHGDIDMFFKAENMQNMQKNIPNLKLVKIINSRDHDHDHAYLKSYLHSIKYESQNGVIFNTVRCTENKRNLLIDFDINACTSHVDVYGKTLYIHSPSETLFYRSNINNVNLQLSSRMRRYIDRGFVLYNDLNMHYKLTNRNYICEFIKKELCMQRLIDNAFKLSDPDIYSNLPYNNGNHTSYTYCLSLGYTILHFEKYCPDLNSEFIDKNPNVINDLIKRIYGADVIMHRLRRIKYLRNLKN